MCYLKFISLGSLWVGLVLWFKKKNPSEHSEYRTYPCNHIFLLSVGFMGRVYVSFANWYLAQNRPTISVY